ncbi:ATP-binding cassette domain-containing protein [archaeon]|nr:MAG: ATP-binding cassette domain-containing protein [archaeon]
MCTPRRVSRTRAHVHTLVVARIVRPRAHAAPQEEGVSADHEPVVLDFARHVTPELVRAAESANAASFIDGFHNKFATHCGDRGSQLSGGQRQRIVIARAVRRAPSIMLLDEATSALDAESEAVVQQALNRLLRENGDMTKILIAHRLSTVRDADKIVVIENGHIVESGRHDDLMKRPGGLYRKLAEAQDAGVEASVVSAGAASSSPTTAA